MGETPRLTLKEAAHATGIPLDVLRKRVYRGTMPAEKVDGQYLIAADVVANLRTAEAPVRDASETLFETGPGRVSDQGETPAAGLVGDHIASLKGEIAFLRGQLDQRSRELAQERERFDVIHREALSRIEAITADAAAPDRGQDAPGGAEAAPMAPDAPRSHLAALIARLLGRGPS